MPMGRTPSAWRSTNSVVEDLPVGGTLTDTFTYTAQIGTQTVTADLIDHD